MKKRFKLCIFLSVGIIFLVLYFCITGLMSKSQFDKLQGTWIYDEHTKYEFDGMGNGCMYYNTLEYEYKYSILQNIVSLDFEDNVVHDCEYEFSVDNGKLKLIGREGTAGGEYLLYLDKRN